MKKVFTLFAIVGMFFFVSCGNSAENKEQGNEDAVEASDELIEEANEAAEEEAVEEEAPAMDSTAADSTEAPADEAAPAEGEEAEAAE